MPTGMESTIKVRIGDFLLTGVVFGSSLFTIGAQVPVSVSGEDIMLFDRKSGKCVCLGNTNPSQLMQAGLGKVAAKTGKPIVMPQFMPKGQSRLKYVKNLMKQNNVPWS